METEHVTYQMTKMSYKEMSKNLAGPISFLKMMCTQMAQETAKDAVQIYGGRGKNKTGTTGRRSTLMLPGF